MWGDFQSISGSRKKIVKYSVSLEIYWIYANKSCSLNLTINHLPWTEESFKKFQSAIYFKISEIRSIALKSCQFFFSTNIVPRVVGSFCILEDATGPLIKQ